MRRDELREKLLVWEYFDYSPEGFFVEVGAHDPRDLSQTWLLERMGWRGVLVEPLPDKCESLRRERPNSLVFEVAVSAPEKAGEADFYVKGMFSALDKNLADNQIRYDAVVRTRVTTLDAVLAEARLPRIDFLSIDTEGTERDVLRGLSVERHRPRLILVEDVLNSLDVHAHLTRRGYRLVRRTGVNSWYVPGDAGFRPSWWERAKLFRKVVLGTRLRAYRFRREKKRMAGKGCPG